MERTRADELQARLDAVLALCKDQRFDLADTAAIRRAASTPEAKP